MIRFFISVITATVLSSTPNLASGMDLVEAQSCINKLLNAYQTKTYPAGIIDEHALISKSFGAAGRIMTKSDKTYATQRAKTIIREAFTKQTGKYVYKRIVAESIERSKKYGYRVTGRLWVSSPKFTGDTTFLALSKNNCRILQVRISGIIALDLQIRQKLEEDRRLEKYFK